MPGKRNVRRVEFGIAAGAGEWKSCRGDTKLSPGRVSPGVLQKGVISTAVDRAIPKSKSVRSESNPISDETLALIKGKRRLRRQYCQIKDPAVKTRINQLQKQVKEELRVESQASWEKFCNSVNLESDPSESWLKIKNFLKPEGQCDYPALHHDDKVAKTNVDKAQLFAKSVERHFGIENKHFDSNHFNEVNKFIENNHGSFCPSDDPDDYRFDLGNEYEDVDLQSLIKLVKFLSTRSRHYTQ